MNRAHIVDVELVCEQDVQPNLRKFLRHAAEPRGCAAQLDELVVACGLTEAEAALVAIGVESTSQSFLLARRRITQNTLKTQVRSILAKDGGHAPRTSCGRCGGRWAGRHKSARGPAFRSSPAGCSRWLT